MVVDCLKADANNYLHQLIGQPLNYGLKSPDMDLYDIGFGNGLHHIQLNGKTIDLPPYILHIVCEFKIVWKIRKETDYYDANISAEQFYTDIQHLIGLIVRRVELSDKNDLWLDLGDCWVVFITFETGEESWRFFTSSTEKGHLVAADTWLKMVF